MRVIRRRGYRNLARAHTVLSQLCSRLIMGHPVSVRLDEDIQSTLEAAARERGIGLATYLREVAANEARRLRRERIRAQSRAVEAYVASSPEAQAFYADWGILASDDENQ